MPRRRRFVERSQNGGRCCSSRLCRHFRCHHRRRRRRRRRRQGHDELSKVNCPGVVRDESVDDVLEGEIGDELVLSEGDAGDWVEVSHSLDVLLNVTPRNGED